MIWKILHIGVGALACTVNEQICMHIFLWVNNGRAYSQICVTKMVLGLGFRSLNAIPAGCIFMNMMPVENSS